MIGRLRGRIELGTTDDEVIIDVNGVGYVVFCSARTLGQFAQGENADLVIETHVREDHIHLYGFASAIERDWFRLLTTVQGVGARMGLAILGHFAPDMLSTTIAAQDKKALTAVSGVGPKLAERIVNELKNKVAKMPTGGAQVMPLHSGTATKGTKAVASVSGIQEEAVSALVNLGYDRSHAFTAVAQFLHESPDAKLDDTIKAGLQTLAV